MCNKMDYPNSIVFLYMINCTKLYRSMDYIKFNSILYMINIKLENAMKISYHVWEETLKRWQRMYKTLLKGIKEILAGLKQKDHIIWLGMEEALSFSICSW